jgi:SPP1 gp7 family putative phage head morphogenesis protein
MSALERRSDLFRAGAEAAEMVLGDIYRVDVVKALNPLNPRDFLVLVNRIAHALQGVSAKAEADALRRALEALDVDWPNLSAAARDQVIRAAHQALGSAEKHVLPRVERVFEVEAPKIGAQTRRTTARWFSLRIGADLTRIDERIARFVSESQGNFIRDEYGRRSEAFSARARDIVSIGIERGLGREDIVEELSAQMTNAAFARSKNYWQVVAMSFANRARTYTQLNAFEESGIQQFRFEAVLDEATSEICRFFHGRVFSVSRATKRFRDVERARDPERIQDLQPWVQVGADDEGNQVLFYERGGRRRVVAQVDEPAVGNSDEVGSYSRDLSNERLEAAGVTVPPLHGRCRSNVVSLGESQ